MTSSNLRQPDCIIRLVSTVLRFATPEIKDQNKHISFVKAFKTVGKNDTTNQTLTQADSARSKLFYSLAVVQYKDTTCKDIIEAVDIYIPLIHKIIASCRAQPDASKLDEKLVFEWKSGMEKKPKYLKGEMLMYELVMALSTKVLATAGYACDLVAAGEFKDASIQLKKAASITNYLTQELLPTWITRGNALQDEQFPMETCVGTNDAFTHLFLGMAQQMAVASILIKPDPPNFTLLSKLSLGISDQYGQFGKVMNQKASKQKAKMDTNYFTLMSFQMTLQRGLAKYFQAMYLWETQKKYGYAISLLCEAITQLVPPLSYSNQSGHGGGLEDIIGGTPLAAIGQDIDSMRKYMQNILNSWEKDNSQIYFEQVPSSIPESLRVREGVPLIKVDEYKLDEGEILIFTLPPNATLIRLAQENEDRRLAQLILEEEEKKLVEERKLSSSLRNLQLEKDKDLAKLLEDNDSQTTSVIKSLQEETDQELAMKIQENEGNIVSSVKAAIEDSDRELAIRLQKLLNGK